MRTRNHPPATPLHPGGEPARSLQGDHRALDRQIEKLESGHGRLFDELSTFGVMLHEHFAREERAPLYTTIPQEAPRTARRLAELLDEHRQMRAEIVALQAAAVAREPDLRTRLEAFLSKFRAHERAEEEILQGALMRDIGAAD